jgi:putative transposase
MSTYTQIYIHIVFRVKYTQLSLKGENRTRVYKYITGIIKNTGHKPIVINGMPDHIHILIGLTPDKTILDLVKEIKRCSTNFINENRFCKGRFAWQEGYGAFSYSRSQLDRVINYIQHQEEHHKKKTFREEYIEILNKYGVDYESKWIE